MVDRQCAGRKWSCLDSSDAMTDSMTAEEYNAFMTKRNTRRKYNNQPVEIDGRRFDSSAEGTRYWELKRLEEAGEISDLECQVSYPLTVHGEVIGEYIADF